MESHRHGQDASSQGTLKQMGQRPTSTGAIGITIVEGTVRAFLLLQLILFCQVDSLQSKVHKVTSLSSSTSLYSFNLLGIQLAQREHRLWVGGRIITGHRFRIRRKASIVCHLQKEGG